MPSFRFNDQNTPFPELVVSNLNILVTLNVKGLIKTKLPTVYYLCCSVYLI